MQSKYLFDSVRILHFSPLCTVFCNAPVTLGFMFPSLLISVIYCSSTFCIFSFICCLWFANVICNKFMYFLAIFKVLTITFTDDFVVTNTDASTLGQVYQFFRCLKNFFDTPFLSCCHYSVSYLHNLYHLLSKLLSQILITYHYFLHFGIFHQ